MLAHAFALILVAQVAADGLTIDPGVPNDLVTWRWTVHNGKAALGWGRIGDNGRFVAISPAPELPCYPESTPKPKPTPDVKPIADIPEFAINGVEAAKMDGKGLTLRASDPATASQARNALYESDMGEPIDSIKLPKFCPSIGPDLSELGLYALAFGLFGVAGVIFVRSLQPR